MENKGALSQVPKTFNYQSPIGFRFLIRRLPNVNYFVQKVNIPSLNLPSADQSSPFITFPQPGDHVVYEPLVLTFKIDEGLGNYIQLQRWLKTIGDSEGGEAYSRLANASTIAGEGIKSEVIVSIEDSAKNAIVDIFYHDAWPTQLSGLNFDATQSDIDYLTATCIFRYSTYDFKTNP